MTLLATKSLGGYVMGSPLKTAILYAETELGPQMRNATIRSIMRDAMLDVRLSILLGHVQVLSEQFLCVLLDAETESS